MVAWQSKVGGEGGRGGGGARRVICPRDRTNILPPLFGQAGKLMALVSRDDEK